MGGAVSDRTPEPEYVTMTHRPFIPWLVLLALIVPAVASAQRAIELPARDRPLRDRPTDVWKVGTDEGESWEMFAGIAQLAFDRNDNLYVLDQGNYRVLVFGPTGRFVREFGKQGGGPGEFQFPASLTILRDGRIAVYDMMRRGFSVFGPDGEYIELVQAPEGYGTPRPDEILAHPLGGIIARAMPAMSLESGVPQDSMPSPVFHQSFGEEGTARTLLRFMMAPPQVTQRDAGGGRQMRMVAFSRPTFAVDPSWGVLPDGRLAISRDLDYSIRLTDPAGATQALLTRPIRGREVTRRDQDDAREQQRRQLRSGESGPGIRVSSTSGGTTAFMRTGGAGGAGMTDDQIEEVVGRMQFADHIPAIQRITVDPTGRIWVRRSAERVGRDEPTDLIASDGRYIGTVTGIEAPRAVSATGLAAWIEKNELDIEQVVVRRLPDSWK